MELPAHDDPRIGQTIGHYRLLQHIGAGGMGVVYRARDERLDRDVAIKVLALGTLSDEGARKRFRREALALSRVNHPNIATIHDFDVENGVDFIVMEYVPGVSVSERVLPGGLPEHDIRHLGLQIAQGLIAAHDQGVVHGDLKPANLRLTHDGRLKILDFGLARLLDPTTKDQTSPDSAVGIAGTLPYMAPEQLKGGNIDERTDIYATGAVLYELAVGRGPFAGFRGPALWQALLHHQPPNPRSVNPQISESLDRLITRALTKDAANRPQSAAELVEALEEPHATDASTPTRRTRNMAVVGAAVLAVLLSGSYLLRVGTPAATTPAAKISIAVLPFHTPAGNEATRLLAIGIPDAIITRLAGTQQLLARPTSAVLQYENATIDARQVGRVLASDYVVTGIVQQSGDRVRISVQLVRARDGVPIWGNHYDVPRSDLLALQDQVAPALADALQVQLSTAERARLFRRYTANAAAYEHYLRGRAHLVHYTAEDVAAAIQAFEGALRLDPNYALARAGVAMACALMVLRFAPEAQASGWGDRAKREARQALKLDPQLAEAHEALAAVYRELEFNWDQTLRESDLALQLNANLDQPHFFRAAAFYHLGLLDLVETEVQAGLDVNPANRIDAVRMRAVGTLFGGGFQKAVPLFEELERLSKGTFDYLLAQALYYAGDPGRAETMLRGIRGSAPGNRRALAILASILAARHEQDEAETIVKTIRHSPRVDHHVSYSLGATYAQLGELPEANRWLAEAARTGFPCYPWYERDPLLDPLRGDRQFQEFLQNQRKAWQELRRRYAAGR
jgi:TolB-like protein